MPQDAAAIDELKANIAFARKRELAFGLCIGKTPETTVLLCHRTKDPEALGRQAKKDGETAKVAFGMMTVEQKNLNLSCQGDIPTGIARRTREMLKLAGLKLKVRVLDPLGNPVEEDGEEEAEDGAQGGAAADPLAEDWAAAKAKAAPRVEAARALPDGPGILADWQAALGRADGGDLRGGIMALEALERRIDTAEQAAEQSDADRARWEQSRPKLEAAVAAVAGLRTPEAEKVRKVWDFIQAKVAAPVPDHAAAVKAIATLVPLIQAARGAPQGPSVAMGGDKGGAASGGGGDAPRTGGTTATAPRPQTPPQAPPQSPPQASGQTPPQAPPQQAKAPADPAQPPAKDAAAADHLAFAEAKLKALDEAIAAFAAGSPDPAPSAWTGPRARMESVVAPMRGPAGRIDVKRLAELVRIIDGMLATIRDKAAEKAAWQRTLDLANLRLVPLDRHPEAGTAPQVAPKIAALKADLARAVEKAKALDFKGATVAANAVVAGAEPVEKLADALAHYKAIHAQRKGFADTPALAHDGVKQVGDLRKAMQKLLADAEKLATKEKFAEAVVKLDQIPPIYDQYRRMNMLVDTYTSRDSDVTAAFQAIDALAAEVRAPFQKKIDGWKKQHAAAKFAKTRDYAASVRALEDLSNILVTYDPANPCWIDRELAASADYDAARKAFEPRLKMFRDHKGRSGIESFYQGMERDQAQATAEAKSGKFSTAAAILRRSAGEWDAQKKLADDNEAYMTRRDEVAGVIAGLKGKPGAEAGTGQAEALMQSAAQQALARNFTQARRTVEEAAKRAEDARKAAEAQAELAKLKNPAALAGAHKDLDAAIKVYDDMRANVAGRAKTPTFAGELARADAEAKKARDEKGKPAPDIAAARQGLAAGIAILEAALPKIMAEAPYRAQLAEAKSLAAGLPARNLDNCIQAQITRVNQAISDAERLAASPGLDFAAASARLVAAREGARKAARDGDLWKDRIKPDRQKIQAALDRITGHADAEVPRMMAPTRTRLTEALAAIDAKRAAEDFKAAAALARTAAEAADRTADDLATVETIIAEYQTRYTDRHGPGAGKVPGPTPAVAQEAIDEMNATHARHLAALAAGNYDAALNLVYQTGWSIDAALRQYAEHGPYETARSAAEAKVNALRAVRNDGVEAEVKAIEKRYDDAVALSAQGRHRPAEKAMLALPADCDKLIARAGDWKGYDDALKAAQAKIAAMEGHAAAEAIRPMTNALRGKLAGAVATAGKGDLKGAKAALDPIPAEADAALRTADAAGAVMTKAGDVATTPIDPAVLDEAQKLYDQVAAHPEAAVARADLDLARSRLDVAKTTSDPTLARAALKASMEACTRAQVTLSQTEMVRKAITAARGTLAALKGHAQAAYIAEETGRIEADLKAAEEDLARSGPDAVGNRVRTSEERAAAAKVLADRQAEYLALRASPEVEPRLEALEKHDHRYAVKGQIDAFRRKLDEAATKSKAKDPAGAIAALEAGRATAQSAWVMAEMRADRPPTPDDIRKIINGPGGDAELDAMLPLLEPDVQRQVLVVAFEARFGTKIDFFTGIDAVTGRPSGVGPELIRDAPNLKRFYDLMSKLPKDHVVDNDSMRKFSVVAGGGSFYDGTTKDVVMREGDAVLSGAYGFGAEHEVGGADEDCKPANDKEVSFFSWNTLHEVGHAVDDRLGYMKRNGARDDHGGWVEHIRDTKTIADRIAPHFRYDATYIGQFLSHNTAPPVPPCPDDCTPEEWESRRVAFEAWAETAFTGGSPWASNATAARIAIGGVVYHESYGWHWSSYKLAARKQGITGYQFRAPGEWFAELYAAYHSDKLKPSHPAVAWLSQL